MTAFDLQPMLTGSTLRVRPLRAEDLEGLYAVAGDPLLWEQHPSPDRHRREVFEPFFATQLASGGALAVESLADGRLVGSSRYDDPDPDAGTVEIGWTFIARERWGGATNRELKGLMIGHAFAQGMTRALFVIGPENRRSRRGIEKLGGRLIGTSPPSRPHPTDWVVYAIDRATWTP